MIVLSVMKLFLALTYDNSDGLEFVIILSNELNVVNADGSYLSVGPVDDTYNNTSYQCIFTINDNIIESDTAGTITVIGMHNYFVAVYQTLIAQIFVIVSLV